METFFSIIYIKPKRISEERIAVGLIGANEGIPFLVWNNKKLNFALGLLNKDLRPLLRKGMRLLDFDINKYRLGKESLPLFDAPITKKILKDLANLKRGKIDYSDLIEISGKINLEDLAKKYLGKNVVRKSQKITGINKLEYQKVLSHNKLINFEKAKKLKIDVYPVILKDYKLDLYRETSYITAFQFDLNIKTTGALVNKLITFSRIANSLNVYSKDNALGKGRYYFVIADKNFLTLPEIKPLITKIKGDFEFITTDELIGKL